MKTKLLLIALCLVSVSVYAKSAQHPVKVISVEWVTSYDITMTHCWIAPCNEIHLVVDDQGTTVTLRKSLPKKSDDYSSWLHEGDEITVRADKQEFWLKQGSKWRSFWIVSEDPAPREK